MNKLFKLLLIVIIVCVSGYFIVGYFSSYIGWYGYKKWKYRVATADIQESKERGVFIKELHFQVDSFSGKLENFKPYIERGFKYGVHSSKETIPLVGSDFPYQLCFSIRTSEKIGLLIQKDQLQKFDSSGAIRGYLRDPKLNDTVIVNIVGKDIHSGVIKIWN